MADTVLIDIMDKSDFNAGSKARNDVKQILEDLSFSPVVIYNRKYGRFGKFIGLLKAYPKLGGNLESGDMVVIQYPYGISVMNQILGRLQKIKKKKNIKIVILLHDVGFLRTAMVSKADMRKKNLQQAEVEIFNRADIIIVHSASMKRVLQNGGVKAQMIELGAFDYLYDGKPVKNRYDKECIQIAFAGNLSEQKSKFLYDCKKFDKIKLNLYGVASEGLPDYLCYKGAFSSEQLIQNMEANYGLVWDGESPKTCAGIAGEYLKYNSPHKCSLYIAAGLPVIIWRQAALSEFIEKSGIGIAIDSLNNMENILAAVSEEEYYNMKNKVLEIRKFLTSGKQLESIIKALKKIETL